MSTLLLGFAGTREEVDWQAAEAAKLGITESTHLESEQAFWSQGTAPRRLSVLPSRVIDMIQSLGTVEFVARAGDGLIYYRGGPPPPKAEAPMRLLQRIKDTYDPKHILPDLPL
jgi:hypothetical protein